MASKWKNKPNPVKDLKKTIKMYREVIGFSNGIDTSTLEKLIRIFKAGKNAGN